MLSNTIDQEIKTAMLAKDQPRLRGLRAIKAAFLLAKTEKGNTEGFTEDAEIKLMQKLIKQRRESADIYQQQGRADLLAVEQEEIDVISQFLPQQLSRDAVEKEIAKIIESSGATTIKEMGRVIGLASKTLAGRADGKLIAEIVKEKLQ